MRNRNNGKTDLRAYGTSCERILQRSSRRRPADRSKDCGRTDRFYDFLWDPLEAQPHDPDVKALLRIAVVYDIPIANNLSTADFMLQSKYMNTSYERKIENFNKTIQDRVKSMKESK